jgi:hypothetical protein
MTFFHFVLGLKHLIATAGLIVFWIFDRKLGPTEEHFPFRAKILLVICVLIPYFYTVDLSAQERRSYFPIVLVIFVASFLIYGAIKWGFEYERIVVESSHGEAGVSYKQEKLMGGFLQKNARSKIKEERITPQMYLAGVQYNPDLVWTKSSRVILRAALVLTYIIVITTFLGAIAIGAAEIADVAAQHQA